MGALFAAAAVFAGRTARAETVLDVPVFAGGYGLSFYEQTARQFEALRAKDHVKVHIYGDPRIADKISVRVIGGDLPDAASAGYVPWPTLIRAGKVIDLSPYLDGPNWEGDRRWRDTFQPGALDSWVVDGHVCGLPFNYACWTIFYNRALFRAHGWTRPRTWDEFFALCDKIKAAGIAPLSLPGTRGLYPDAFLRAAYYNLAGPAGWRALNSLQPGAYTSPAYIQAAALLQRVTQHETLNGWEGATHTGAQLAFLEGRAAMTVSGSWMVNEMAGKIPAGFELGAMNFPVFPNGRGDPTAIQTGSDCFFVFNTGHPQRERLTIDFLRYLTSRARAAAFVRQMNSPVAVRGVPRSAYSPGMQDTIEMIEHARAAFNMPQTMMQPPVLLQTLTDARFKLMAGELTPQQYGARLEAAAEIDRERRAHPNRIDYRHPVAGTLLLVGLIGGAVWLLGGARRPRRAGSVLPARTRGEGTPPTTVSNSAAGTPLAAGGNSATRSSAAAAGESAKGTSRSTSGQGAAATLGRVRPAPAGTFGPLRPSVAATFLGPSLLLYAALVILPALSAFAWAFTQWNGLGPRRFNGLFNFKSLLFENDTLWHALRNNAFLVVVPTLVVVPVALLFAAVIHRGVAGGKVFRVIFLFPNMLGGIAATLLWLNAYEPRGGLINASLVALGNLLHSDWLRSFDGYPWLTPDHLYGSLVPIYLWMACGFNLILYLAAMEGIDTQLYEAAELDGAGPVHQFFHITLPMIWDVIGISVVFLVIGGLNAFELVWLLTSQDPPSETHTLGTLLVTTMFKYFDVGRAAALAVLLLVLVLVASGAVLRLLKREAIE